MDETDLGLNEHWTARAVIDQATTMTSLTHQHLAAHNPNITILHAFPGLVRTDIFVKLKAGDGAGWVKILGIGLLKAIVAVMMRMVGISPADSGERQAFHLTSDKYEAGAWRVDERSEIVTKSGVHEEYVARGWAEKVWDYTQGVFEKSLTL